MSLLHASQEYVVDLLRTKLSPDLIFHTVEHTLDVVDTSKIIAIDEGIALDLQEDLLLAALFHDTGYTQTSEGHEKAGVQIANLFLNNFNVPRKKINRISRIILATQCDYSPESTAERIIKDADMVHLSRSNYQESLLRLRKEWRWTLGVAYSEKAWLKLNLDFLNQHTYFTDYAINNFSDGKRKNAGFIEKVWQQVDPFDTILDASSQKYFPA